MKPLDRFCFRLRLVIALAMVCCTPAGATPTGTARAADTNQAVAKPNLKLLTWNIQMLPALGGIADLAKKQTVRAPWVVEYLNAQDYDIVVLQEVIDKKMTALLREGLKGKYPHILAGEAKKGVSGTAGGNLIVSRLPLTYVAHTVYENVSGVDALAEKGCLVVEGEKDGVRFQLIGTHLQAGNNAVKEKEFGEIYAGAIKPFERAGVPQLLAGDMNTASDRPDESERFQLLLSTTEMQSFPTDDPRPFTVDSENTWRAGKKKSQKIDHVLLNPRGTQTTILRQTIQRARHEHEGALMDLSDHYGVIAEILLKK